MGRGPKEVFQMTLSQRAYLVAQSQVGFEEVPGDEANPQILKYHQCTDLRATSDEVAWCSAFVNFCMQVSGGRGTQDAMARSWLDWGIPIKTPQEGDLVVFSSPTRGPGAGHIAFFKCRSLPGFIKVLGGNQGNKVCFKEYPTALILGYRRSKD